MSVNRNFVVKNGLEVSSNLIVANADTKRVGIASTNPQYTLDVRGGIGATDVYVSGIGTVLTELNVGTGGTVLTALGSGLIGVGTASPAYLLDVRSPVSMGQTALYVYGDVKVTGDLNVDDITLDDATIQNLEVTDTLIVGTSGGSGIATIGTLGVTGITTTQFLQVTGVSTFAGFVDVNNSVDISNNLNVSGVSTFAGITTVTGTTLFTKQLNSSGVVTASAYYVDGTSVINNSRQLQNIASLDATTTATIEAAIANGPNTFTDLTVSGVSTFVGLATFNSGLRVVSGITTLGIATVSQLYSIGIVTASSFVPSSGYIKSPDGTNSFYIYSGTGNVAFQGTIGASQLNSASGLKVIGLLGNDAAFENNIIVSGASTLGTVKISSGIITASSGIVTYYGDGQYLNLSSNPTLPTSGIGIATVGGTVGTGATILDFRGAGISTITVASGIATINITGGGSGSASIGIGTTPGEAFPGIVTTGNLWYNSNIGRLFIYYADNDSQQWVDAAPFNVGIITSLTNVSFYSGSATSPSMYFIGDQQTGFFSPTPGQFTIVSTGSSVLNINPNGINVTGVVTASSFVGNVTGTATGLSGTPNLNVGVVTASSFVGNVTGTATGLSGTPNLNVGVVTTLTKLDVGVGGTTLTTISSTGNVGIRTANPIQPFQVGSAGTTVVVVDNTGEVGIGTTNPVSKLDLFGGSTQSIITVSASNINCSLGNYFTDTINGTTTYTVSNIPSNRVYSFTLEVNHTSGTINWFSGVEWPNGTAPTLTTGKTHLFMFVTDDGGTRWRASSLINYTT